MNNFRLHLPTEVLFGRGVESQVGETAAKYGKRALLVFGKGSVVRSGLLAREIAACRIPVVTGIGRRLRGIRRSAAESYSRSRRGGRFKSGSLRRGYDHRSRRRKLH